MENKKDTRSASERITNLENGLMSLYQTLDNMARDLIVIKDAMKLLDNKVSSIVKAASANQPITDDVIRKIMVDNNCEEMAEKVKTWVAQGFLSPSTQIGEDSFVVLRELSDDGTVVNPRYQFVYSELKKQNSLVCEKILGTQVNDTVQVEEGKFRLQIAEVYTITQPQQAAEAAPETEVAAEAVVESAPEVETPPAQTQVEQIQAAT